MNNGKFSIKKRLKSFTYAFAGLKVAFRDEHNMWIHGTATVCVLVAGALLGLSAMEWVAVAIVIGMVISAEVVNSALERTADFVKAERDDRKRDIKDLAAGAVLICAVGAAVVGVIIFLPYLITFIISLI